jgi:hypothetical protein
MSVTITIEVDDGEAAGLAVGTAPSATPGTTTQGEDAPAPMLLSASGDRHTIGDNDGEGPPPMDLAALGGSSFVSASPDHAGTPPDDLLELDEPGNADSSEPMPIEDLEKSTKSTRSKKS